MYYSIIPDAALWQAISEAGQYIVCTINATLEIIQHLRLYRINMDARTMLAVRFMQTTHELQVFLTVGPPPKRLRRALSNSKCFVPANSNDTIMLIRNKCQNFDRVYMAVQVSYKQT